MEEFDEEGNPLDIYTGDIIPVDLRLTVQEGSHQRIYNKASLYQNMKIFIDAGQDPKTKLTSPYTREKFPDSVFDELGEFGKNLTIEVNLFSRNKINQTLNLDNFVMIGELLMQVNNFDLNLTYQYKSLYLTNLQLPISHFSHNPLALQTSLFFDTQRKIVALTSLLKFVRSISRSSYDRYYNFSKRLLSKIRTEIQSFEIPKPDQVNSEYFELLQLYRGINYVKKYDKYDKYIIKIFEIVSESPLGCQDFISQILAVGDYSDLEIIFGLTGHSCFKMPEHYLKLISNRIEISPKMIELCLDTMKDKKIDWQPHPILENIQSQHRIYQMLVNIEYSNQEKREVAIEVIVSLIGSLLKFPNPFVVDYNQVRDIGVRHGIMRKYMSTIEMILNHSVTDLEPRVLTQALSEMTSSQRGQLGNFWGKIKIEQFSKIIQLVRIGLAYDFIEDYSNAQNSSLEEILVKILSNRCFQIFDSYVRDGAKNLNLNQIVELLMKSGEKDISATLVKLKKYGANLDMRNYGKISDNNLLIVLANYGTLSKTHIWEADSDLLITLLNMTHYSPQEILDHYLDGLVKWRNVIPGMLIEFSAVLNTPHKIKKISIDAVTNSDQYTLEVLFGHYDVDLIPIADMILSTSDSEIKEYLGSRISCK